MRNDSYVLSFTEKEIQGWASCDNTTGICTGTIGALFITTTESYSTRFLPQLIQQPLRFDLNVPPMVCTTLRTLPVQPRAELHYYVATNTYAVRILGAVWGGDSIKFQWGTNQWIETRNTPERMIIVTPPPSQQCNNVSLRITDSINTIRIDPPITPIVHGSVLRSTHAGILVELLYGFGFSATPSFGDTEQIITVMAKSTQPVRLKRLVTVTNPGGQTTAYTTAKGFIADTKRVMDLTIACYQDTASLSRWLLQAIQLLDTTGLPHAEFIQRSCRMVVEREVAKAFWLIPIRGPVDRTANAGVDVVAEFA